MRDGKSWLIAPVFLCGLVCALLSSCAPTTSATTSASTSSSARILGWPFDTAQGHWVIENGYNWNTSNGGLDHGCSNLPHYNSCYELDSFDFQIAGPAGSTAHKRVLSPVSGMLVNFDSAVGRAGKCVSITVDDHPDVHVLLCHVDNPPPNGHVTKGQDIGGINGDRVGGKYLFSDHLHITLYSLDHNLAGGDSTANASKRQPMAFTGDWNIGGCSYPADGSKDQYGEPGTSVPC